MSLDGSYDMVLLPPQHDNDNDDRQPARRRRTRRRLPPWRKSSIRACPVAFLVAEGGGGATMAKQEAAPRWLSSESTTPAPQRGTSGVDLAPETTTSDVSPQHANPKRTDDASTLAEGLLGVSLVPDITVQSIPDATSSPSIDREVPSVFHPVSFRFSFDPPSDSASVSAFIKAYPNLPGYHMWSTWDRLTAVSTYGPPGSEEDDKPDSGWVSPGSVILAPCETS
jgi:hypothetical protein